MDEAQPSVAPNCEANSTVRCLYFSYKENIYNAQKCYQNHLNKEDAKAIKTEEYLDKFQDYIDIMAAIEEANQCSGGFCSLNRTDGKLDVLPIYVFSNVNDGVPQRGCHPFVQDLIA